MRYAAKVDTNQAAIRTALERCGCVVISLASLGRGIPDLLVYRKASGLLRLLEVKAPKGKLTEAQAETFLRLPVWVVRTVEDALDAMEIQRAA